MSLPREKKKKSKKGLKEVSEPELVLDGRDFQNLCVGSKSNKVAKEKSVEDCSINNK